MSLEAINQEDQRIINVLTSGTVIEQLEEAKNFLWHYLNNEDSELSDLESAITFICEAQKKL